MELKNIGSTFSPKTDDALSELMAKNNLSKDKKLLLTGLTMFFSRGEISEEKMIGALVKEAGITQKTAEQISKDIQIKLIPTLWNKLPPEEKQAFLRKKPENIEQLPEEEDDSRPEPFQKNPHNNVIIRRDIPVPKKISRNPAPSSGPDKYRESI